RRSVVVLAGDHVAAASGSVNLEHFGIVGLAAAAPQTDKIARGATLAVVAHRVNGVTAHGNDGLIAVPETQGFKPGIDEALWFGADGRIMGGTGAIEAWFAIRPKVPAIGGQLLDLGLADAEMADGARLFQALSQTPGHALDRLFVKFEVANLAG